MTLSKAIELIGNDKVRFQYLDTDAAGATRSKKHTKFSFFTGEAGPEYLLGNHSKICVILWLPRGKWEEALNAPIAPVDNRSDAPAALIAENARLKSEVEERRKLMADIVRVIGRGCCGLSYNEIAPLVQAHKDALKEAKAGLWKINKYPVHSEPVGGAMAMQDIANDTLATINTVLGETEGK